MAEEKLKLVVVGEDRSGSKTLKGVGKQADATAGKLGGMSKMGPALKAGLAGGLLAVGAAAVSFGADSLTAFAEADKAQKQLEDAYRRFPKTANLNIEALRKYNQEVQRKTGADADDLASGQAVLARYKLTGKQLKDMTPLLVDYSNRTGKTIPASAGVLGKAIMGNAKAMKELGIKFKDTGDPAKNYQLIMAGLQDTVGGYTDSMPEAAKKQKILEASFGDLQEEVGERLQPVMLGLIDAGQGVMDWLEQNPQVVEGGAAAFSLFGDVLTGLWEIIRKFVAPGLAFLLRTQLGVVDGTAAMLDALGQVPGFEWAKEAATKVRGVADGVRTVADGLDALAKDAPPEIDLDDSKVTEKTKKIDDKIVKLNRKRIKLVSEGDTKGADKIAKKIRGLEKKKHDIKIGVGLKKSGPQTVTIVRGGTGGTRKISLNASGHPSFPGGLTWVGEAGPEVLELPTGSRLHSNAQSRAMAAQGRLGGGSGGGATIVMQLRSQSGDSPYAAGEWMEKELVKLLRKNKQLRFQR